MTVVADGAGMAKAMRLHSEKAQTSTFHEAPN